MAMPTDADEVIQEQLKGRLAALESAFKADALCLVGPLFTKVDDLVRQLTEAMKKRSKSRSRLVVFLTTDGGVLEPTRRIADTFRTHYEHVSFVVPNRAMSAGTILVMSGDEIYMDYYARLGPIDPQVVSSSDPDKLVPALGYLKRWDELVDKSNKGELSPAELAVILDFDQAELYDYEQHRQLSVNLVQEWLVNYKFKNWTLTEARKRKVSREMKEKRAEEIGSILNDIEKWHSHGYGISMKQLHDEVRLKVRDLAQGPERHDIVKHYHELFTDFMIRRRMRGVLHTLESYTPYMTAVS